MIAINATCAEFESGGIGVYTINIIKELVKIEPNLLVCAIKRRDIFDEKCMKVYYTTRLLRPTKGITAHLLRVVWSQTVWPVFLRRGRKLVALAPSPFEAMINPSLPQVVIIHDIEPLLFPRQCPRQTYFFRYVLPVILRKSKKIIAVSHNTKNDLIKEYRIDSQKIEVIYEGYDKTVFNPNVSAEFVTKKYGLNDYCLYVGRLVPHKNLARLIKAFSLVSREVKDLQLVIVGRKNRRFSSEFESRAKDSGVFNRILFLDWVPLEDLAPLYKRAKVLVYPSLYEGFGLPPLEAMACGTPVITSNISSLPEVVGDAALLVDPYNVEDIANSIVKVIRDQDLSARLSNKGLQRASQFSWEKCAREILGVMKNAV